MTSADVARWIESHTFNQGEPINLDDMGEDNLREFVKFGDGDRLALCEMAFADHPLGIAMLTIDRLIQYAEKRLQSNIARLNGRMMAAAAYETGCDNIYEGLPEFAKW